MTETERLLAIEEIKLLKARYFRGVDSRDAALLRAVFTDDALTDFRSESPTADPALMQRDPAAFVQNTLRVLEGIVSAHTASMPEIEILSSDEARALWPMSDRLWTQDPSMARLPFKTLEGWGVYHDSYRRTADGWRIASTRLERTKVIVT